MTSAAGWIDFEDKLPTPYPSFVLFERLREISHLVLEQGRKKGREGEKGGGREGGERKREEI